MAAPILSTEEMGAQKPAENEQAYLMQDITLFSRDD